MNFALTLLKREGSVQGEVGGGGETEQLEIHIFEGCHRPSKYQLLPLTSAVIHLNPPVPQTPPSPLTTPHLPEPLQQEGCCTVTGSADSSPLYSRRAA